MKYTKTFRQISKKNVKIAGGKGASLGEMTTIGIAVPPGFIILANAFEEFLHETDIYVKIAAMWDRINIKDMESIEENSKIIRDLITKAKMPKNIGESILNEFKKLKTKYVAVRSSATAEDSAIDSWAGQLETYLNTTKQNLLQNIQKCWASLFSPRAIFYRVERKLHRKQVSVAVVVQKMIQSKIAGTCFTVHPVTKDKNQIVIEAIFGLGEAIVSGIVTPDTYVVDKKNLIILDKNVRVQEKMIKKINNQNKIVTVPKSKKHLQKLSDKLILKLAKQCIKIEKHYKIPQDIEWGIEKEKIYILQSRPITTL